MNIFFTFVNFFLLFSLLKAQDQTLDVEPGVTVKLQCRPSSTRPEIPTEFQWFDSNNVMKGTSETLLLPEFSYEHQGVYTCKASQLIDGQIASNSRSLLVRIKSASKGDQNMLSVPSSYETFVNGIIFFQCKITTGDSNDYRFEWISPTGERYQSYTYFKNKATREDAGRHVCKATRISDNVVLEGYTFVNIQQIPMIVVSSGSEAKGGTLSLKCSIDTEKLQKKVFVTFEFEWLDPSNRQISTNSMVNILIRDSSSYGFYICRIKTEASNPAYTQEFRYEVKAPKSIPTITETSNYIASFVSSPLITRFFQSLQLICQVQPPLSGASYQMTFNGKPLSMNSVYIIPRFDKENMGVYECVITGMDANRQLITVTTKLSIQPEYRSSLKIDLIPPPGPQTIVRIGDKRELHCEIPLSSGVTGKEAVWYFDGQELSPDQLSRYNIQVIPRLSVSIVVLQSIQTNNQGRYECRIRGQAKEAYIIVMSNARNIEVNPSEETRKVGDGRPVEFHCRTDGYSTKNRELIWTFTSSSTGQTVPLDNRWRRSDDITADETSFIVLQQVESVDAGTYICTEPSTLNTARAVLNVMSEMRIVVTPPIIKLRVGGTATVQCYAMNDGRSTSYPEFSLRGGRSGIGGRGMSTKRLETGKIQMQYEFVTASDNGTEFICTHGGSMAKSILLVEEMCESGFRMCRNGECINSARFCDGRQDCRDGSDEDEKFCRSCDPLSKRCESYNGLPPFNNYFQLHWSCDGEDDCGNGFDESKCFGHVLTCGGLNYRCNDGIKTIPKAFMCDKERDCPNGDDEDRCMSPAIINEQSPSYQISVKRGETLTLSCQAAAYPMAKIVWRYNWGCLNDETRMIVTESYRDCSTTVSTMKILNFQPGDDGIYNCEALSGGKRAWSRDYQVLMDFQN